ncbi:T9SS type A sorting domain-containing protein [Nonlabens sp.]|uniref:T9SS type A sorting domain-containing protein n=1 Tax=Nonlabens sp. TaxID=1888209 RepID=UPI00261F36AF|nr:T9SS type A sorting domain-containing protein [Nonlabens sp.]
MRKIFTGLFIVFCLGAQAQFWTETSSGFSTNFRGLSKFHVVDANLAWAIGYDGFNTANNIQQFSKTDDSGLTWSSGVFDLGDTSLGIADLSGVDSNTAFVAAYPRQAGQQGGIWKTTDAGVTWTQQTAASFNNVASFPNIVHYFDANNGLAIGDPTNGYWEIYTSNNGGTTYSRIPSASLPAPLNNETGYLSQFAYSGDSIWFTTSAGRIIHSANRGVTWSVYQSPLSDFEGTTIFGDISFATSNRGVIQDNAGNIFKTTDGGQTWNAVVFSGTGTPYGGAISYLPNTFHMVSTGGEANFAGSSYSVDDGTTWINIDTDQHVGVAFFNDTVGYSGSFSNATNNLGVFRYTGSVLNEASVEELGEVQLFHNNQTGQLEVATGQQFKNLRIYDLHGQLGLTSTSTLISTNLIPSGVYIAQIFTDTGLKTSKFIKY